MRRNIMKYVVILVVSFFVCSQVSAFASWKGANIEVNIPKTGEYNDSKSSILPIDSFNERSMFENILMNVVQTLNTPFTLAFDFVTLTMINITGTLWETDLNIAREILKFILWTPFKYLFSSSDTSSTAVVPANDQETQKEDNSSVEQPQTEQKKEKEDVSNSREPLRPTVEPLEPEPIIEKIPAKEVEEKEDILQIVTSGIQEFLKLFKIDKVHENKVQQEKPLQEKGESSAKPQNNHQVTDSNREREKKSKGKIPTEQILPERTQETIPIPVESSLNSSQISEQRQVLSGDSLPKKRYRAAQKLEALDPSNAKFWKIIKELNSENSVVRRKILEAIVYPDVFEYVKQFSQKHLLLHEIVRFLSIGNNRELYDLGVETLAMLVDQDMYDSFSSEMQNNLVEVLVRIFATTDITIQKTIGEIIYKSMGKNLLGNLSLERTTALLQLFSEKLLNISDENLIFFGISILEFLFSSIQNNERIKSKVIFLFEQKGFSLFLNKQVLEKVRNMYSHLVDYDAKEELLVSVNPKKRLKGLVSLMLLDEQFGDVWKGLYDISLETKENRVSVTTQVCQNENLQPLFAGASKKSKHTFISFMLMLMMDPQFDNVQSQLIEFSKSLSFVDEDFEMIVKLLFEGNITFSQYTARVDFLEAFLTKERIGIFLTPIVEQISAQDGYIGNYSVQVLERIKDTKQEMFLLFLKNNKKLNRNIFAKLQTKMNESDFLELSTVINLYAFFVKNTDRKLIDVSARQALGARLGVLKNSDDTQVAQASEKLLLLLKKEDIFVPTPQIDQLEQQLAKRQKTWKDRLDRLREKSTISQAQYSKLLEQAVEIHAALVERVKSIKTNTKEKTVVALIYHDYIFSETEITPKEYLKTIWQGLYSPEISKDDKVLVLRFLIETVPTVHIYNFSATDDVELKNLATQTLPFAWYLEVGDSYASFLGIVESLKIEDNDYGVYLQAIKDSKIELDKRRNLILAKILRTIQTMPNDFPKIIIELISVYFARTGNQEILLFLERAKQKYSAESSYLNLMVERVKKIETRTLDERINAFRIQHNLKNVINEFKKINNDVNNEYTYDQKNVFIEKMNNVILPSMLRFQFEAEVANQEILVTLLTKINTFFIESLIVFAKNNRGAARMKIYRSFLWYSELKNANTILPKGYKEKFIDGLGKIRQK